MSLATHLGGHAPSESNPDSSQARSVPFIGCRLSLISKVGVRYEGTLLGVDSDKGELTLGNARSYGTEERRVERPIAPQPYEYQSITFKGDSISELMVPEAPVPPVGADPAVVQAQSAPGSRAVLNPLSALTGNWPQAAGVQFPFIPAPASFPGFPIGTAAQASQPRVPLSSSAPLMPGAPTSTLSTLPRPPFPTGVPYIPYAGHLPGVPPVPAGGPHGPIGAAPVGYQQAAPPTHPPPTSMGPIAPPGPRPPAPFLSTQTTPSIARELAPPHAFASPPQMGPSPPAPATGNYFGQVRPAPQPTAPVSPPQPQPPPAQPQPIRLAPEQPPAPIQSPVNKPTSVFQAPNLPPRLAAQANSAFSQPPQARAQAPSQPAPSLASQAAGSFASATQQQQQAQQVTPQVDRQRPTQASDAFADRNKPKVEEEQYEEADEGEKNQADYSEPGDKQTRGPSGGSWPSAVTSQPMRSNRIVEYPPDDDDTVAVGNFEGAAGASPPQRGSARPMKFDNFGSSSFNRPQANSQGFQRGFGMGRGRPRGGRFQRGGPLPAWSQDNQLEVPAIPGQLGAPRMTVTLNTSFTNRSGADNASQTSTSTRRTLEPETPRGFGGFYVGRGGMYSRGLPRGGAQQYHRPMEYEQYGNEYEEERGGFYSQPPSRGRGWYNSAPMGHQSHTSQPQGYQDVGYGGGAPPQSSALRGRARGYSASSSMTRGGSTGAQQQRSSNRPELNWPSNNSRWGGWGWNGGGGAGAGGQPANQNLSFNAWQRAPGFQQMRQGAFGQSGSSSYRGRGAFEARGAGAQQVKRQQQQQRPRRGSDGELNPAKISVNVGNDYDFESNNAEFAKLVDALSIEGMDKSDLLSPTEGHEELEGEGDGKALEEGEVAENEPASKEHESAAAGEGAGEESSAGVGAVNLSVQLNVNVSAGAGTNRVSGSSTPSTQTTANTYNKKTSFFDNLKSGENNKEGPSVGHLSDDRKLNVETFGPGASNLRHFGQRTRYRGMSRGGRGGYQRGRWPR